MKTLPFEPLQLLENFSPFSVSTSFSTAVLPSSTSTQDTDHHPYKLLGPVVELLPVLLHISTRLEALIPEGTVNTPIDLGPSYLFF
ncbi:hypothetical protein PGTUg99_016759 [Puccinia graminis f. sp. tritici]|uniref:Uncharacterized protein n=1 Tax=Puccinia graminis f. sp. tritici TaxID=56615 RepID=A0A5B0QQU9_PUCGR|nr:hypothetical protein PGTUg99_016759 [Puccinia graminis f. sp. tritici]